MNPVRKVYLPLMDFIENILNALFFSKMVVNF